MVPGEGGCVDALSMQLWCNRHIATTTDSPAGVRVKWEEGVQSKQVWKKPPEGCSRESEVVTRNALEIGCNGKKWKRGGKRVISSLTTEWGLAGRHQTKPRGL